MMTFDEIDDVASEILVFYAGYGVNSEKWWQAKDKIKLLRESDDERCFLDKLKPLYESDDGRERGFFYLPPEVGISVYIHGVADVSHLLLVDDGLLNDEIKKCFIGFDITDKDGKSDTFTIRKGIEQYRNESGNTLRVYWKDNVPTDEKPMSENERNTLLKLILGMAIDGYSYQVNDDRSPLTGTTSDGLSAMLKTHGIEISHKTIKKYLTEAKEKCMHKK